MGALQVRLKSVLRDCLTLQHAAPVEPLNLSPGTSGHGPIRHGAVRLRWILGGGGRLSHLAAKEGHVPGRAVSSHTRVQVQRLTGI